MAGSRAWLAAGSVVLTLAGCTPGQVGETNPSPPAPGTTTSEQLTFADGPLYPYRALIYGGGLDPSVGEQEQRRLYIQQQNKISELIAACMTEQGFQFTYRPQSEELVVSDGDWKPDDREWVSRYGYGVTNYPGRVPPGNEPADKPNEDDYQLSEAEEEAFQEALFGDSDATDWRDRGCRGAAEHEVIGYQARQDAENQPIVEAITQFISELSSAAEFAPLDAEWASCMTERDFPDFGRQPDAEQSINNLLSEYFPSNEDSDGPRPWELDPRFATLDDPDYAAIAEQEVKVALADLECRQQTDYTNRHLAIQFELEERFIANHREELDAMKARAEQAKK